MNGSQDLSVAVPSNKVDGPCSLPLFFASRAAYPAENPITPHDLVATMYHALGVSPDIELYDRLNRPHRLVSGQPIRDLFT